MFELFDISCNLSPAEVEERIKECKEKSIIMSMHPHGIIPLHGWIWAAYCDAYFGSDCYGFGAAADAVFYVPFLRNIIVRIE